MQNYLEGYFGKDKITRIEPLAQAGSDRKYYRIFTSNNNSYIACESSNIIENETFIYFSQFFKQHQIRVPKIIDIDFSRTKYILEDVGNESLLDKISTDGCTNELKEIYKSAISSLVQMQMIGGEKLDFSKCYSSSLFDKNAVLSDLNYFKYYFLDLHKIVYNKTQLNNEFEKLASQIGSIEPLYFMYRDFQGRNIMIQNNQPSFIDYQGGMKGPLQYDIASLLWQAKAQLLPEWKKSLYAHYKIELGKHITIDEKNFDSNYSLIILARLLQVLGAYGLRGIIEKRTHFLASIPLGLKNIKEWRTQFSLKGYSELNILLEKLEEEVINYTPKNQNPKVDIPNLKVVIQSFSYKKGIPNDTSGNGGGYVFDCRGILNPGRFEEYKKLTGRDKSVKDFLEDKTKINEFLSHVKGAIDISLEDYINRGFENLMISFGCTGGQHRSVYCTDAIGEYVKEKYNVEVKINHIEQEAKGWVN